MPAESPDGSQRGCLCALLYRFAEFRYTVLCVRSSSFLRPSVIPVVFDSDCYSPDAATRNVSRCCCVTRGYQACFIIQINRVNRLMLSQCSLDIARLLDRDGMQKHNQPAPYGATLAEGQARMSP